MFLRWPKDAWGSALGPPLPGGGREKDSMSVQSTASDLLASLSSSVMLASSRLPQTACSADGGCPPGLCLSPASASATRPKVYPACR